MTSRSRRLAAVLAVAVLTGCGSNAVQPETAPALGDLADRAGAEVTLSAEVAALVSARAFTVVRREGSGAEPLLVVLDAPMVLSEELPVTVTGTVGIFSAEDYPGLAEPVRLQQYDGRPYLQAREVDRAVLPSTRR